MIHVLNESFKTSQTIHATNEFVEAFEQLTPFQISKEFLFLTRGDNIDVFERFARSARMNK